MHPASVQAITSWLAASIAALRFSEMPPGPSIRRTPRPAYAVTMSLVESVEPPSATTISSGGLVPARSASSRPAIVSSSFRAGMITLTGVVGSFVMPPS